MTLVVVRLGIGLALLWAGLVKLHRLARFAAVLAEMFPVLGSVRVPVAFLVVGGELVAAAGLLAAFPWAPVGAAGLFAIFATASAIVLRTHTSAVCACFGSDVAEPLSLVTTARAASLAPFCLLTGVGGSGHVIASEVPLALLTAAGVAILIRFVSVLPIAWAALRAPAPEAPNTRRQSFRYVGPSDSLFKLEATAGNPVLTPEQVREGGR